MKFIDLFNKNKDCADFLHRQKMFKTYKYLMQKSPDDFKIEWNGRFFRYYQKTKQRIKTPIGKSIVGCVWEELDNSSGKYKAMGEYNEF